MIRHARLLLPAFAVVLSATLLAAPAQAASFTVTLGISTTKPDVGTTMTLIGKVSGSGAGGAALEVQRRVGSGSWTKIKTLKASSAGTYKHVYTVTRTGAQSLRVVAPKKGSTHTGTSQSRAFTGWTWLKLYDESYYSSGSVQRGWVGTVNGGTPPRDTFGLYSWDSKSNHSSLAWRTEEVCDRLRARAGISDSDDATRYVRVSVGAADTNVEVVSSEISTIDLSLAGSSSLNIERYAGSGDGYIALESPRAHCKTSSMPIAYD